MYGEGGRGGGFRPRGGGYSGGSSYGGGNFSGSSDVAPVNVGDELDVRIEAVGEKGDGIARKRGFVLFVPNTKEGQEVRIRVTKVLRKVGFAESIGAPQGAIPTEAKRESAPREEYARPEPVRNEPPPQDTDNFGEEPSTDDLEVPPAPEEEGSEKSSEEPSEEEDK